MKKWSVEKTDYTIIAKKLADLADAADIAMMTKEADSISALLPSFGILKKAQYEGFYNHFIANGRAFEKACKQKIDSGKTPQEAWLEVLEEYQDAVLTDKTDFIKKYASIESDKQTNKVILNKIAERILAGSSAGIAIHEAIASLATDFEQDLAKKTFDVLNKLASSEDEKISTSAKALVKEAAFSDLWEGAKNWYKKNFGNGFYPVLKQIEQEWDNAYYFLLGTQTNPKPIPETNAALSRLINNLKPFINAWNHLGYSPKQLPDFKKYVDKTTKLFKADENLLKQMQDIKSIATIDNVKNMEAAFKTGDALGLREEETPPPPAAEPSSIEILKKSLDANVLSASNFLASLTGPTPLSKVSIQLSPLFKSMNEFVKLWNQAGLAPIKVPDVKKYLDKNNLFVATPEFNKEITSIVELATPENLKYISENAGTKDDTWTPPAKEEGSVPASSAPVAPAKTIEQQLNEEAANRKVPVNVLVKSLNDYLAGGGKIEAFFGAKP